MLLELGADPNVYPKPPSMLHLAMTDRCVELVELLLTHGAKVNARDYFGYPPISAVRPYWFLFKILADRATGTRLTKKEIAAIHTLLRTGEVDLSLRGKGGSRHYILWHISQTRRQSLRNFWQEAQTRSQSTTTEGHLYGSANAEETKIYIIYWWPRRIDERVFKSRQPNCSPVTEMVVYTIFPHGNFLL
ncbi:hypothetical protein EX30DRAFT_207483 [Ascodesmis nigricans]|uniref:Uncharacterized protein n=1 Tax=Ascodesmis nigricans TaxID=341454 RepID=A0A4S2MPP4_9PEZI|nr:hypothetical protein EX30DRAFT_207483 [Ascodesmis nigricans]